MFSHYSFVDYPLVMAFSKMKYFIFTLSLLFVEINGYQTQFYFPFIANYFKEYGVKLAIFFNCWNKREIVNLNQQMSEMGIRCFFIRSKRYTNVALTLLEKKFVYYAYVLDLSCEQFSDILSSKTDKYTFKLTRPWLIFAKYDNSNTSSSSVQWKTTFANISLRMDSNVTLAIPGKKQDTFSLLTAYNPGFKFGKKPVIAELGSWNGTSLMINRNSTFYTERRNMSSITLRAGSVILNKDYSGNFEEYMLDRRNIELDTLSKYHYAVFLVVKDVHSFTYTVKVFDTWFGNYQNGTDAGAAQYLYEGKGDINCAGASPRAPRIDCFDYLILTYHFTSGYIFRNPRTYDPFLNEFLKPFSDMVWYLVLLSMVIICIFLKMLHSIENKLKGSKAKYSWATVILITLSITFQQGSSVCPNGHATRLVFVVLQLVSIVLFNYYTSSIISALLSAPPHFFHTLDELGRSDLEIAIEDHPYTITYFKIMNYSDVQYIWKHKVFPEGAKHVNSYEAEEGIAKVRNGGFAYHTQLNTGYPIIAKTFDQDAICDLNTIPMIQQGLAGLITRKHSEYSELFKITLQRMNQAGLVHRISQIWESKKPQCLSSANVAAVGTDQTFIAFLGLMFGMAFALLFLIVEVVWFKCDIDNLINQANFAY